MGLAAAEALQRRPSQERKESPTLDTAAVLSPSQRPPLPSIASSLSRSSATQLWVTYQANGTAEHQTSKDTSTAGYDKSKSDLQVNVSDREEHIEILNFEQALKIGPPSPPSSDAASEPSKASPAATGAENDGTPAAVKKPEIVLGITSALAVAGNVGSGPASPRFQLPDPAKQTPENNKLSGVQRITNALGLGWIVDKSGRAKTTQPSTVPNHPSSDSIASHTETIDASPASRRSDPGAPLRHLADQAGEDGRRSAASSHGHRASFAWSFSSTSKVKSAKE